MASCSSSSIGVYRLRTTVYGHSKDVKSVAAMVKPENCFVTTSRDNSARVWVPQDDAIDFREALVMTGHVGFVNAVTYLAPCDSHPHGVIYTGGQDKMINAYTVESPLPFAQLSGHEDNVCTLFCQRGGILISGSWDKTARVWINHKCAMVLKEHHAAIWAVAGIPKAGVIITGSADKTIKLWKAGKCASTLIGHEDCVRALCVLNDGEFLSSSNDSTIRRWSVVSGGCLQVFVGHSGFVYSLSLIPGTNFFISSGEDRSTRIWDLDSEECTQTISLPCQSLWAVACLDNTDILVGCSDATIRVFSHVAERIADEETILAFEAEVSGSSIPQKIGEMETEKLPGPEILDKPGNKEGQVVMVRNKTKIEAHQWSSIECRWMKVGDVVGGQGGETVNQKTTYQGQDYDYLFTVDIEDGKPPLQLPYNKTEDPWFAAQAFVDKNNLPQAYLEQVAGFIIKNSDQSETITTHATYQDPFTGTGRYIPASAPSLPNTSGGVYNDPFTGGSRYVPGGGSSGEGFHNTFDRGVTPQLIAKYIPWKEYSIISTANLAGITNKLTEFNSSVSHPVPDHVIAMLEDLSEGRIASQAVIEDLFNCCRLWPKDKVFPLLDVLRLAVRHENVAVLLTAKPEFVEFCTSLLDPAGPIPCQMLTLRILANLANNQSGRRHLQKYVAVTLSAINALSTNQSNAQLLLALSALLLNLFILLSNQNIGEAKIIEILSISNRFLSHSKESFKDDSAFNLIVMIGSADQFSETLHALVKDGGFKPLVAHFKSTSYAVKVTEAATVVESFL